MHDFSTCKIESDSQFIIFSNLWLSVFLTIGAEEHLSEGVMVDRSFHLENQ